MLALLRTMLGLVVGGVLAKFMGVVSWFHAPATKEGRKVGRRSFVRNAALGAVLILVAQFTAGFVRFFWPNKTGAFGSDIPVPAANIPAVGGQPLTVPQGKFYVVHTDAGLMAIYWRCVHLGCTVPWVVAEEKFHCPCHGSIYAYNGDRESGPAPRALDYMTIKAGAAGGIIVDTGAINTRQVYEPSQAFPVPA